MSRRSAASLSVVSVGGQPLRLQPPDHLGKAARLAFIEIVNSVAPEHFHLSDRELIASLAQATVQVRRSLSKDPALWERAVRVQMALARSLRLTPQARARRRTSPPPRLSAYEQMELDDERA